MQTKDEIFQVLAEILSQEFEIPRDEINLDSNLYSDLQLDSIDAVDLVVRLKEITGKKIDPEAFKAVRTLQHVVDETYKLLHG